MVPVIGSVAMGVSSWLLYWATTRLGRIRPKSHELDTNASK